MGQYQPTTNEGISDWGADLSLTIGIGIDLLLFTVPLEYELMNIMFGSFKQYEDYVRELSLQSVSENKSFTLRKPYSSDAPEWLPEEAALQSAFNETSPQIIVRNGYEHPDVQLANLSGGGVLMAFLDSDASRVERKAKEPRLPAAVLIRAAFRLYPHGSTPFDDSGYI